MSAVFAAAAADSAQPGSRTALIVTAAQLYVEQRLSQPEVAARLGLTQSTVSRLLKEAERRGIVRTIVVAPEGLHSELEAELCERLGLREVVVAGVPRDGAESSDPAVALPAVGAAAAAYLESRIRAGERIGVSSRSAALLATLESMAPLEVRAELVAQTLGSLGSAAMRAQAPRLTDRLARLAAAEPLYLPAPGVVGSRVVRDGLLEDPALAETRTAWDSLTMLVSGVGALAAPAAADAVPDPLLAELAAAGAVGDVCLNFFDAEGREVDRGLRERVIGIDATQVRAVPRRVGVASGRAKATAIRAAARGGWIDVLVTDVEAAQGVLALGA